MTSVIAQPTTTTPTTTTSQPIMFGTPTLTTIPPALVSGVSVMPPPAIPIPDDELPTIYDLTDDSFEIIKAESKDVPGEKDQSYITATPTIIFKGRKSNKFIIPETTTTPIITNVDEKKKNDKGFFKTSNAVGIVCDLKTPEGLRLHNALETVVRGTAKAILKFAEHSDVGKGIVGESNTIEKMMTEIGRLDKIAKDKKTRLPKPNALPTFWMKAKTRKDGVIFSKFRYPGEDGRSHDLKDVNFLKDREYSPKLTTCLEYASIYRGLSDKGGCNPQFYISSAMYLGREKKAQTFDLESHVSQYASSKSKDELADIKGSVEAGAIEWSEKKERQEAEARAKKEAEEDKKKLFMPSTPTSAPPPRGAESYMTPTNFVPSQYAAPGYGGYPMPSTGAPPSAGPPTIQNAPPGMYPPGMTFPPTMAGYSGMPYAPRS